MLPPRLVILHVRGLFSGSETFWGRREIGGWEGSGERRNHITPNQTCITTNEDSGSAVLGPFKVNVVQFSFREGHPT